MEKLLAKLQTIYHNADARSGGRLGIVGRSYIRFLELLGPEAAAGMAYYALFSLFPLTLLMVSALGFVLESELAYNQALQFILALFPFSGDLINNNLGEVLQKRGALGTLGVIGLVWSASGFFTILARNVNRAWPSVKLRGFVQGRLVAFGMVGALFLLLLLSLISSTLLSLAPDMVRIFGMDEAVLESTPWRTILRLVPAVFTFLLFTGLYRWVPNKLVRWKAVLLGALTITIAWELAKSVFTLYLRSGFAQFEIVYGSLGTLIALMVWIYVSNVIALFGAHLVATLDLRQEKKLQEESAHMERQPADKPHRPGIEQSLIPNTYKKADDHHPRRGIEKDVPKSMHG